MPELAQLAVELQRASVVDESSMSIRTKLAAGPRVGDDRLEVLAAEIEVELEPEPGQLDRDVRVEALAVDPREHVVVWPAISRASSGLVTSSPRTSTVASFPSPFSSRTTRTASSSVGPAM